MSENSIKPPVNIYKILFFILLFLMIIGIVAVVAYVYGMTEGSGWIAKMQRRSVTGTPVITQTQASASAGVETVTVTVTPEVAFVDTDVVTPGPNTVSFARNGDTLLLKYRNKIYDETNQTGMEPLKNIKEEDYTWFGLVNAPDFVPPGEFMYDEVFGLKTAPDKKSFVFIMRWGPKVTDQDTIEYYVYHYSPSPSAKVHLVKKFTPKEKYEGGYYVPKMDVFNSTGDFFSLQMYPCWNCGGGRPAHLIVDWQARTFKFLGPVSYFGFGEGRTYSYKESKEIDCVGESIGSCYEKPENLPVKQGDF